MPPWIYKRKKKTSKKPSFDFRAMARKEHGTRLGREKELLEKLPDHYVNEEVKGLKAAKRRVYVTRTRDYGMAKKDQEKARAKYGDPLYYAKFERADIDLRLDQAKREQEKRKKRNKKPRSRFFRR